MTTSTAQIVKMSNGDRAIWLRPTLSPTIENGAGNERNRPPQISAAPASRATSRPRVTMTATSGDLFSTGRTSVTSTRAPRTSPATRATMKATQYEMCRSMRLTAT